MGKTIDLSDLVFPLAMPSNGPPKATPSTLGSYTLPLYMIKALLGPKKGPKHTQNSSRMIFRVQIFLFYHPKMAQNGLKWPPKGYPEYTWVIFWVTAQALGLLGTQKGAKTDTEGHQSKVQGLNCQDP